MNIIKLHNTIISLAPIDGADYRDTTDKSTWKIKFSPSATEEQKQAVKDFIALETTVITKVSSDDDAS